MIWEDPTPSYRGKPGQSHWHAVIAELKQHPGQWAKHPKRLNKSMATQLANKYPGLETATRHNAPDPDGKTRADLYYRWMGGEND